MSRRFAIALFALSLARLPASAQTILQWKFRPGEIIRYALTLDQTVTRSTSQESACAQTEMTLTVRDVGPDRAAHLMLVIDRAQYKKKLSTTEIHYDSKSDAEPVGLEPKSAAHLKELLSSEFIFKMTPQGEVSDIRVAARDQQKSETPSLKPASAPIAKLVKNLVPAFLLPEEPVSAGRSWQEQREYLEPNRGIRKMDITYHYIRPELYGGRPAEKIGFAADVRYVAIPPSRLSVGIKRSDCSGTVYFDKSAGLLALREYKEKLSLVLYEDRRRTEEEVETTVTVKLEK
jgi:hypothetical protein